MITQERYKQEQVEDTNRSEDSRRMEQAICAIVKATAGSGENFFRGLVAELGTILEMKYAFVGALQPTSPKRVRTVAVWARGEIVPNFEYDLADTPCATLAGQGFCHFPRSVRSAFPRDKLLSDLGAESYLGIPLHDASGEALGLLCVLNDRPMPNSLTAESLMRIFAARAASELERQSAVEALKASEARYRQLHDSMMDAFVGVDMNGQITNYNEAFRQLLGYEPGEMPALTFRDITPEKWHALETKIIEKQVLTRGYSDIYEKEYRRKDGTVFPVELRTILLRDDTGTPSGMWAIVRDITKRKRAVEALRRQLGFDDLVTGLLARFASCTGPEIDEHICASLQEIARFIGVDYAIVVLTSTDLSTWSITHEWCAPDAPSRRARYQQVPMGTSPWTEKLLEAGKVVQIHTLDDFPPEAANIRRRWQSAGVKSSLQVPLRGRGRLVHGCIGLFGISRQVTWNLEDIQRLRMFSDAIANVLERQQAESALQQSEAQARALLDATTESLLLLARNGKILAANATAANRYGRTSQEFVGANIFALQPPALAASRRQAFDEVVRTGRSKRIEDTHEGRTYDNCLCPVHDAQGRVEQIAVFSTDITERKQAEILQAGEKQVLEMIAQRRPLPEVLDALCRFVDQLTPGVLSSILLLDSDGQRLWPIAGPKLPPCWTEAITPLPVGPHIGSCGRAAHCKEQVVVSDIATAPLWASYPALRDLALSCSLRACWSTPIMSAGGHVLGTFALYADQPSSPQPDHLQIIGHVTHLARIAIEHERASAALRQARDQLEHRVRERTAELVKANERLQELDRLKSQFLATMSHELRTPLNSIIGFTGILQRGFAGPVNDEQKKQLGLVHNSATHLLSLINDLLDLSRIEAGKIEIEHEPFDFAEVVKEVVENLKPTASRKHLSLVAELPNSPLKLTGDRKRCFQVLLNLVSNAVKFTRQGEIRITAKTEQDQLQVCVADTGMGIKPEQMGMLFEAFRQLDGSAKRVYEGTGLGLYLSRKLLKRMGGDIRAESVFGKGSRFIFTLPRHQQPAGETETRA